METPETIRTSCQAGEWVRSIDVQDTYFHIPIQKPVQKVSAVSRTGSNILVQSTIIWSLNSTHGIYGSVEGGQTDCLTKGYKNPPVPR